MQHCRMPHLPVPLHTPAIMVVIIIRHMLTTAEEFTTADLEPCVILGLHRARPRPCVLVICRARTMSCQGDVRRRTRVFITWLCHAHGVLQCGYVMLMACCNVVMSCSWRVAMWLCHAHGVLQCGYFMLMACCCFITWLCHAHVVLQLGLHYSMLWYSGVMSRKHFRVQVEAQSHQVDSGSSCLLIHPHVLYKQPLRARPGCGRAITTRCNSLLPLLLT